jgi:dephospho-CoA kinase
LKAFARRGAEVASSDEIVHRLLAGDEEVRREVVERFGPQVHDGSGAIDRAALARVVFADRPALEALEAILHPRVVREYTAWREELGRRPDPPPVAVVEVPLLYETGGDKRFDKVVVITAPAKLREQRRRVVRDDRDARLIPDKEKVKRADFAYVNTGTLDELDAWVADVMAKLTG